MLSTPTNVLSSSTATCSVSLEELHRAVIDASRMTAMCLSHHSSLPPYMERLNIFTCCQSPNHIAKLAAKIEAKPILARVRQSNSEFIGFTPLHTACMHVNVEGVRFLLNSQQVTGISSWDRDLYGRTPLHVLFIKSVTKATIANQIEICKLLLASMTREKGFEPVGVNAPVDMADITPIAVAVKAASSSSVPIEDLKALLFKPGDSVIFPFTPIQDRLGASPLKSYRSSPRSPRGLPTPSVVGSSNKFASPLFSPMLGRQQSTMNQLTPASRLLSTPIRSSMGPAITPLIHKSISTSSYFASAIKTGTKLEMTTSEPVVDDFAINCDAVISSQINLGSENNSEAKADYATAAVDSESGVSAETASMLYSNDIAFGHSVANGWRGSMEDRVSVSCPLTLRVPYPSDPSEEFFMSVGVFGVIDGHDGAGAAAYLADKLPAVVSTVAMELITLVLKEISTADNDEISSQIDRNAKLWRQVMFVVCERLEDMLAKEPMMELKFKPPGPNQTNQNVSYASEANGGGAAAVFACITQSLVCVAGVGDSRCILVSRSSESEGTHQKSVRTTRMSIDHKFDPVHLPYECQRAIEAGAFLTPVGGDKEFLQVSTNDPKSCEITQFMLRMSRSFGDFPLKQIQNVPKDKQPVIAVPDVYIHRRTADADLFVVLACDGIWDVLSDDEVGQELTGFMHRSQTCNNADMKEFDCAESLASACDHILSVCMQRAADDNLSIIAISLSSELNNCNSSNVSVKQDQLADSARKLFLE